MINYNSILTPDYKINKKQFCEFYDIKELYIDYYVDKIMSNRLGFYMFIRDNDFFFFHEEDLLGTTTLRLIKDHLLEEMIYLNVIGRKSFYDLDKMAEEITIQLKDMGLIWFGIQEQFEMLIEKLIIKTALDIGIPKELLTDMVIQSERLLKTEEGTASLLNIIEGSEKYEDLNIVSIRAAKEVKLDDLLGPLQGFCPNCGKIILEGDTSKSCSQCELKFNPKDLLKSIDEAKEAGLRFKQEKLQEDQLMTCPNPDCEAMIGVGWEECPLCHTIIEINNKKSIKE
jgi:hypothetical protein